MRLNLQVPYPLRLFCLHLGGHTFANLISTEMLLVDRNVLAKLKKFDALANEGDKYWLAIFSRCAQNINPIFTAYEGCFARKPSKVEFVAELQKARAELEVLYPHKKIINHPAEMAEGLYDALAIKFERQGKEIEFLLASASIAANRPSREELMPKIRDVIAVAHDYGIGTSSLVPVALMSCLADKSGGQASAARRLLKPKMKYLHGDAYNAVADIHNLDFLISLSASDLNTAVLCTMDLGLAEFWIKLKVASPKKTPDNDVTFRFSIDSDLFPRLDENQLDELRSLLQ